MGRNFVVEWREVTPEEPVGAQPAGAPTLDFSTVRHDLQRAMQPWRSHPRAALAVVIWLVMSALTVGLWLSRMAAAYPHG